jgi:uncharacterized protein YbcV (DUF1398 family)
MSKARKIAEKMLAAENLPVKAIRKTQFLQQNDGSTIQKVLDADGTVISKTIKICDPFYNEKNQARLARSLADAEAGKVTIRELTEAE